MERKILYIATDHFALHCFDTVGWDRLYKSSPKSAVVCRVGR